MLLIVTFRYVELLWAVEGCGRRRQHPLKVVFYFGWRVVCVLVLACAMVIIIRYAVWLKLCGCRRQCVSGDIDALKARGCGAGWNSCT